MNTFTIEGAYVCFLLIYIGIVVVTLRYVFGGFTVS
jgi:hypothetical protein